MQRALIYRFLLLGLAVLGLMLTAMATTWTVPNGDSLTQIQTIISGAVAGDTISFASSGTYNLNGSLTDTTTNNLTFIGNGCTLNLTATTANSLLYLDNVSGVAFSGFTLNGNAYGGSICIANCSSLTITNNTLENNTYIGSNGGAEGEITINGLTNSTITFNTLSGCITDAIGLYNINNVQVEDNTFSNNTECDQIQIEGLSGADNAGIVFQFNVATNNCGRYGLEIGDGSDTSYPSTTNMLVDSNIFSMSYGNCNGNGDGAQGCISLVNSGTGTTVTNNILTLLPTLATGGCGFIETESDMSEPLNMTVKNNVMTTTQVNGPDAGTYSTHDNMGLSDTANLFVNVTSPMSDGSTSCGGAADVFQNNWAYGCTIAQASNYNLSGACPTMSIAETSNPIVGGANGVFTITASSAPSQSTSVYYTLSGTGVNGTNYTITPASPATIAAGTTSTTLTVTGLTNGDTIIATLAFGPYYINSAAKSATMTIQSGSLPTVTVAASPTSINEAGGSSTYTVTRTGSTTSALTVNYAMSGTATNGTDYNTLSGSMTIASGSATGTVILTTIDRGLTSGSVTAILTISSSANYTVGSPSNATVTINDNDSGSTTTGTIDDNNSSVSYSGFTLQTGGAGDYDSTEHYSNTTNAYAQYTFNATAVTVVGKRGPNYGIAGIYIDGTLKASIDCYANVSSSGLTQQDMYTITGLSSGSHTVKVVVTGTKNASSSNYYVTVDALDFPSIPTSGLQLWLKGDLGATWDGTSNVAGWADMSGNGMNATQATAADKPTLVTSDINSLPGVRFNGSSDALQMPSGFANFTGGISAFVVTIPTGTTAYGRLFELSATSPTETHNFMFMRSNTTQTWELGTDEASWEELDGTGTTALTQSSWQLLEAVEASSGSATVYKNGGNALSGTVNVPANTTRAYNYIGAFPGQSQYWTGDIAEVILYNTALTTAQRQAVESYLSTKYGQSW